MAGEVLTPIIFTGSLRQALLPCCPTTPAIRSIESSFFDDLCEMGPPSRLLHKPTVRKNTHPPRRHLDFSRPSEIPFLANAVAELTSSASCDSEDMLTGGHDGSVGPTPLADSKKSRSVEFQGSAGKEDLLVDHVSDLCW